MSEPTIWQQIGVDLQALVAGFVGGLVNAIVFKRVSPGAMVGSVIVGMSTGNYLGPIIGNYLAQLTGHYTGTTGGAAAFLTGFAGMILCQRIAVAAREWRPFQQKGNPDV